MNNFQEKKILVVLHGWGKHTGSWQPVVRFLESQGIKVYYPALPGLDEKRLLSRAWNLDDYLIWFENFLKQNQINDFFVLGHSFGGRMAIKFGAENPKGLKGLVLVAAAGIRNRKRARLSAWLAGLAGLFKKLSFLPGYRLFRKFVYRFILRKTDYLRLGDQTMRETFKNVIEEDLSPLLFKIKIPTLLIWGEKDKDVCLKEGQLMNERIADSKLEILKDLGHSPQKECPEVLAEKIMAFLNQNV